MKMTLLTMLVIVLLGSGISMSQAADPLAEQEASPTIKERLTKNTIEGSS